VGIVIGAALFWWNPTPSMGLVSLIVLGFIQAPFFPLLLLATAKRVGPEHGENSISIQMGTAGLIGAVVRGAIGTIGENQGIEMMAVALFVVAAALLVLHELVYRQRSVPAPAVSTGD
jgi:fucose permease